MVTKEAVETDMSRPVLEELLSQGYDIAVFRAGPDACPICQEKDGDTKTLDELIASLSHDAPLFEWTHPNCVDRIYLSGPDLPNISVDKDGNVEAA